MDTSLFQLITRVQNNDKNALQEIIDKFKPLINKLARKLKYEEAETDLIIAIILLLKNINLEKFKNTSDDAIVNYINYSLNNKATDLFRKYVFKKDNELPIDLDIIYQNNDMDTNLFVNSLLNIESLSKKQHIVLKLSYLYGFSDIEIAKKLNISRQAVNKIKKRGLKILNEFLT